MPFPLFIALPHQDNSHIPVGFPPNVRTQRIHYVDYRISRLRVADYEEISDRSGLADLCNMLGMRCSALSRI